jgi:predicted nucleic acid-binding protein
VTSVIDASVAVAYLLGVASELERLAILGDVHAPSLLDVEVTQTLRNLVRRGKLDLATARLGRDELAQLGLRRHPDAVLLHGAWQLRDTCTIHDGLYVALAAALDASFVTRDARLARGVGRIVRIAAI